MGKKIETLKYYYVGLRSLYKQHRICNNENVKKDFLAAELIRFTHSIEKGLSIESPRLGFGHDKIEKMKKLMEVIYTADNSYYLEVCGMALGAMKAYLTFHEERRFEDDFNRQLNEFIKNFINDKAIDSYWGGVINVSKEKLRFNTPEIEYFFNTRHSIRDFDDSDIDINRLKSALKLAQKAPSACNRQGVRVHIVTNSDDIDILCDQLQGIGGFADSTKCFAIITAKLSAYRIGEINQYIVSASMYAAYLTLTLHLYGMGGCVIQRPLIYSKQWERNRNKFNMDIDEQVVCLLAIGNLKNNFSIPESHRLENEFIKFQ